MTVPVGLLPMVPLVNETGPVSVRIFVPTPNIPLVSVRVPATVALPARLTPAALLTVKLLKVMAVVPPMV